MTEVETDALLFSVLGSDSLALTVAVLLIVPAVVGVTTMVTPTVAALATLPRLHVTVPPAWLQFPCAEDAETKVTPAGNVSLTVTPLAVDGPALLTEIA